jgi:hypothetical protein
MILLDAAIHSEHGLIRCDIRVRSAERSIDCCVVYRKYVHFTVSYW